MIIYTDQQLAEAVELLKRGEVLVYPTETSYGIGCDATNGEAIEKIFAIKGRPVGKAMTVLVRDIREAREYVLVSDRASRLAEQYWPGALTMVLPRLDGSKIARLCGADGWQSVRVSSHPVAGELVARLGRPLVSTSANLSGQPELYSARELNEVFANAQHGPDALLDVGDLPRVPPSTIVKIDGDHLKIIRQGAITLGSSLES